MGCRWPTSLTATRSVSSPATITPPFSTPPPPQTTGEMVSTDGRVLGTHPGVQHFTVGQRKGLGVTAPNPLYVLQTDAATQRVVVGAESGLMRRELAASACHWIADAPPAAPIRVTARIRHRHRPAAAWAEPLPNTRLRVTFDAPQRAITPGQSVVLYQDD